MGGEGRNPCGRLSAGHCCAAGGGAGSQGVRMVVTLNYSSVGPHRLWIISGDFTVPDFRGFLYQEGCCLVLQGCVVSGEAPRGLARETELQLELAAAAATEGDRTAQGLRAGQFLALAQALTFLCLCRHSRVLQF
jgi:hypothetical protein